MLIIPNEKKYGVFHKTAKKDEDDKEPANN